MANYHDSYTIEQHVQMIKLFFSKLLKLYYQFCRKIIINDKTHFCMNGYVYKQNWRIWDNANPHEIHQVPIHPQKLTVWCDCVIGPYFFENDIDEDITINGEPITDFFWPKLNNMWLLQDGTTCHTADATMDILHERFEGMVISRRGDMNWPPISCDLTPLDFFLWGFLKSQVYANKRKSTDVIKVKITNAIAQIQPDLCGRVIENWTKS